MKPVKWLFELETCEMNSSHSQRLLKTDLPILKSQTQYWVNLPCALIIAVCIPFMEPIIHARQSCWMSFHLEIHLNFKSICTIVEKTSRKFKVGNATGSKDILI